MNKVYLDYASTTPLDPDVSDLMHSQLETLYGNPSSPHGIGQQARKALETAREKVARMLRARSQDIIFTSGATESNNQALFGIARSQKNKGNHIIVSAVEHHSVLRPVEELRGLGYDVTILSVDQFGRVDPQVLEQAITPKTILIALIHASNEIGTFQPVEAVGAIARRSNIHFHVDAVQTVGHVPVDVQAIGCDTLSLSAHKFYGPKGVGALYIREGVVIESLIYGGDQESGLRASTQNVPGIIGMAHALEMSCAGMQDEMRAQLKLRDQIIETTLKNIPGSFLNGHPVDRLPNNAHFSFEGIDGESLLTSLDLNGYCASMGSACTSGELKPSHVLKAIGLSDAMALGSLRVTIGRWTTAKQVDAFISQLEQSVKSLRKK